MDADRPRLDQLNIVGGNVEASIAFYRQLGVEITEEGVWRTPSGIHPVNAGRDALGSTVALDIDSVPCARLSNTGWQGRRDLRGRVVVGFKLSSRSAVDTLYASLTGAGHAGLQPPNVAFWGSR